MGHFVIVPINLTCPHCLQHFFFEHLFHLYYVINVYGYNQDDTSLFNTLNTIIMENNNNTFIIGGDFNTKVNLLLDKKNGNLHAHKQG